MMEFPITNTSYDYVNTFVNTLAPIVCNEWVKRRKNNEKTISPAVVLAQGGKESGWNLNATTLFGIKGNDITLDTTEYINGSYISVQDGFATYPDIAGAVQGYYDLMQWENYDDATSADTVEGELEGLTNDIGLKYATAPDYYQTTLDIINDFNLKVYNDYVCSVLNDSDSSEESTVNKVAVDETPSLKSIDEIADEIYRGEWGNGDERKQRLEEAGYDYEACQTAMEQKYYSDTAEESPSNEAVEETVALHTGQEVKFTGTTNVDGVSLLYTDRIYTICEFQGDNGEKALLDIYGEHYAVVWTSELEPV